MGQVKESSKPGAVPIVAGDFAIDILGPDTEVEIEDDGSAYITTTHGVIHAFFAFDGDEVARLTLFP